MSRAEPAAEIVRGDFVVELMSEHDLLEVVEIEEASGLSLWGWDAYRSELGRAEAIMLVARKRSSGEASPGLRELLGFIAARVNSDELHINNIGVRETARRCGVGSALLSRTLELAENFGARSAVLEVRSTNEVAQALYRRHGFETRGRRRDYYRDPTDDALLMGRALEPPA